MLRGIILIDISIALVISISKKTVFIKDRLINIRFIDIEALIDVRQCLCLIEAEIDPCARCGILHHTAADGANVDIFGVHAVRLLRVGDHIVHGHGGLNLAEEGGD